MTTTKRNDWYQFDMEQAQELERLRKENAALRGRLELQRELSVRRALIIQDTADRLEAILKSPDSTDLYMAVYDYSRELSRAAENGEQHE